ncbi:unnamed protein product, partial [Phaeothamnion confervicola]
MYQPSALSDADGAPEVKESAVKTPEPLPDNQGSAWSSSPAAGGNDGLVRAGSGMQHLWAARREHMLGSVDVRSPSSVSLGSPSYIRAARTPDYAAILNERGRRRSSMAGTAGFGGGGNFESNHGNSAHGGRGHGSSSGQGSSWRRRIAPLMAGSGSGPGGSGGGSGGSGRAAGGSVGNGGGGQPSWGSEHEFVDVWEELDYIGHNLTSVLNNPREGWIDQLYEVFDPEQNYPIESYAPEEAAAAASTHLTEEADVAPVQPFLRATGPLVRTFFRNHKNLAEAQRIGGGGGGGGVPGGGPGGMGRKDSESSLNGGGEGSVAGESLGNGGNATPRFGVGPPSARRRVPSMVGISSKAVTALLNGAQNPTVGDTARCFEEVPAYFFDSEFSLQNPDIFERVILRAGPEQQEQLTHYLDLVEVCLLKQISIRSDAFFEGLETTHVLKSHVSDACRSVYQLRLAVQSMEADVVAKALEVPRLARRQQNLLALHDLLERAQGVLSSRGAVQALLAAEDYTGALDIIESARAALQGGGLAETQCLKQVGRQLADYEDLVGDLLGGQFVSIAVSISGSGDGDGGGLDGCGDGYGDGYRDGGGGDGFSYDDRPWSPGSGGGGGLGEGEAGEDAAGRTMGRRQEEQLTPVVAGLLRLKRLAPVLDAYRQRLDDDLKLIIRTVVGDYLSTTDDAGELLDSFVFSGIGDADGGGGGGGGGGSGLSASGEGKAIQTQSVSKLKTLEQEAFAACLEMCFEHMLATLSRAAAVHCFLADALAPRATPAATEPGGAAAAPATNGGLHGQSSSDAAAAPMSGKLDAANGALAAERGSSAAGGSNGSAPALPAATDGAEAAAGPAAAASAGSTAAAAAAEPAAEPTLHGREWPPLAPEEALALTARSEACLRAVSELIERSVGQLLSVRRDFHATRLSAEELKALWDSCTTFVRRVEALSGASGYRLRQTLLAQAKAFVEHRHESNKAALVARLDAEKWSQVDVLTERQAGLDRLTSGRAFLPSKDGSVSAAGSAATAATGGSAAGRRSSDSGGGSTSGGAAANAALCNDKGRRLDSPQGGAVSAAPSRERKKEATADGQSYKVVWSALVLVEMVTGFLQFAAHFPAIATDVLSRVAELLRLYNSRTTQLVLGAGAIHSAARLKSISAKHLALCSQSLGLVRALVPHMRAALAAQLPPKHHTLLVEMDKVSQRTGLPGAPRQDNGQVCVYHRGARGRLGRVARRHRLGRPRARRRPVPVHRGRGARRGGHAPCPAAAAPTRAAQG